MKKKLEALRQLTKLSREAELARLRELAKEEAELKSMLLELNSGDLGSVLAGDTSDRLLVAHEIRAHTVSAWKSRKTAEINRSRSQVRAKMETQKRKASRAFGRDEALAAGIKKLPD